MTGNLELEKFAAYPAALGQCIVQAWQGAGSSDMDSLMSVTSVGTLAWLQPADEEDGQAVPYNVRAAALAEPAGGHGRLTSRCRR